jgi:gliding motility-associated-like protein
LTYLVDVTTNSGGGVGDITGEEGVDGNSGNLYATAMNIASLVNDTDNDIEVTFTFTPELAGCAIGTPVAVVVTLEPTPSLTPTLTTAATICDGDVVNITLANNSTSSVGGALTYLVDVTTNSGGGVGDITGEEGVDGTSGVLYATAMNIASLVNDTDNDIEVTFMFTPELAGCAIGTPVAVVVTLEPTPSLTPSLTTLATICDGDAVNITLANNSTSSVGGSLTYAVGVTTNSGGGVADITGEEGVDGTAGILYATAMNVASLVNDTDDDIEVTFTFTPELAGCGIGTPVSVVVTLEPTPSLIANLNTANAICDGGLVDISITTVVASSISVNQRYNIAVATNSGGGVADLTGEEVFNGLTGQSYPGSLITNLTNNTNAEIEVTFTFTPTLVGCANGTPVDVIVTLEPTPSLTPTLTTAATICDGDAVNITLANNSTSSVAGSLTYAVGVTTNSGGGVGDITGEEGVDGTSGVLYATAMNIASLVNDTDNDIEVTFTFTPELAGCATGTPVAVVVTLEPNPRLTTSLNTAAAICSGELVNITLTNQSTSSGPAFTYLTEVFSSTNDLDDITGEETINGISQVYALAVNETITNNTAASLQVTFRFTPELAGCTVGAFEEVVVTIDPTPVMTSPIIEEICSGGSPSISFSSDSPATYLWEVKSVTNVTGTAISDAGNDLSSEVLFNTSGADGTVTYEVVATGTTGLTCDGPPQIVTITVNPAPLMTSANSETICSGNTPSINFSSNVVGSTFNWIATSVDPDISGTFVNKVGTDFTSELLTNFGVGAVAATYDVTPTGPGGCVGITQTVTVTVDPGPAGVPDTQQACSNIALNYDIYADNINNGGNGVLGQFTYVVSEVSTSGIKLESPNRTTSSTLPITFNYVNTTATPAIVRYTITPVGFGACTAGTPFDVDFVINPEPVIAPISETICSGEIPSITVSSSNFGLGTVDYTYVVSNITGTVTGVVLGDPGITTTIPHTITNMSSAQAIVTYTFTPTENINNGCAGEDFDVLITVDPEPVGSDTILAEICSGDPINVAADSFIANLSGNIFSWSVIDYEGATGGVGSGLEAISETLTNTTNAIINVKYDIIPTSSGGSCPGASFRVTIPINPEPTFDPTIIPSPVCSDVIAGVTLGVDATIPSIAADHYDIASVMIDPDLTVVQVTTGTNLASNAIFNDQFINTTNGDLSVTYKVTPVSAKGCSGEEVDLVLIVQPSPALEANLDNIVCSGAPTAISLTIDANSIGATNYRIEGMTAVGLDESGSATKSTDVFPQTIGVADINIFSADVFVNTTDDPLDVVYLVTPLKNACEGPTQSITITVEPEFSINDPVDHTICSGQSTSFTLDSDKNPTQGDIEYSIIAVPSSGLVTGWTPTLNNLVEGSLISQALENAADQPETVEYLISYGAPLAANGSGCSVGAGQSVIVTVDPIPVLNQAFPSPICSGDQLSIELESPTTLSDGNLVDFVIEDIDYASGNVAGSRVIGDVFGNFIDTGIAFTDDLVNNGTTSQIVTYTLIPRNARDLTVCQGNPVQVSVTVAPTPTNFVASADPEICENSIILVNFEFPVGQSPFTFDYEVVNTGDGVVRTTGTSVAGTTGIAVINGLAESNGGLGIAQDITARLIRVRDFNGCEVSGNLASVDIDIINVDASFAPVDDAACTPAVIEFAYTLDTDVEYTWNWGDGSMEVIDGAVAVSPMTHEYVNQSLGDFTYTAFLTAKHKTLECLSFSSESVTIYPAVIPNVFTTRSEICSGDEVNMFNVTLGATAHEWTYSINGNSMTDQDQTQETPSFTFVNNDPTLSNPQEYVIHYRGSKNNGGGDECFVEAEVSVMVYREAIADFDTQEIGRRLFSLELGAVEIPFVNNSTPINDTDFSYDWNYGNGIVSTEYIPEAQTYTVARTYDVIHTIVNQQALANGLQCSSDMLITIEVDQDPIVPDFSADIKTGCEPTVFTITNLTTGAANQFEWRVYDAGSVIFQTTQTTSQATGEIDPDVKQFSFEIAQSGIYTVELVAQNVQAGPAFDVTETKVDYLNVFEAPLAAFEMRPSNVVFVPDEELTLFNFTNTGQGSVTEDAQGRSRELIFEWDYGDGSDIVTGGVENPDAYHTYEEESFDQADSVFAVSLVASFKYNLETCSNVFRDSIRAEFGGSVDTPNAFTPNQDGPSTSGGAVDPDDRSNDIFIPKIDGVTRNGFLMQIYNRWGVFIFESKDAKIGWDGYYKGKMMPQGVYVYKLSLQLANGKREVRIGDITLLK